MVKHSDYCLLPLSTHQDTEKLGALLATYLPNLQLITLRGPLGSGKTTLTRGFLHACGIKGRIKSPTYTLVEIYPLPIKTIYHFDLYRIQSPEELYFLGMDEYLNKNSLCLIEWPEQAGVYLPLADLDIQLEYMPTVNEEVARQACIYAHTLIGQTILKEFMEK